MQELSPLRRLALTADLDQLQHERPPGHNVRAPWEEVPANLMFSCAAHRPCSALLAHQGFQDAALAAALTAYDCDLGQSQLQVHGDLHTNFMICKRMCAWEPRKDREHAESM
eukprot:1159792-Pelagomonas_calceolata.AAC.4